MANPTPAIEFRVNLTLLSSEVISPKGTETGVLHPDRHSEDQEAAIESIAHRGTLRSAYVPSLTLGNRQWKHGDTFTEYGQKAVYLRSTYGIGYAPKDRAILEVVSVS